MEEIEFLIWDFVSKNFSKYKMALCMIDETNSANDELLLHNTDFPSNFVNMAHPDDYKILDKPIIPEYIYNDKSHHYRLIFRISWKLGENKYVPMSFVCDTGAPMFFYICEKAQNILQNRICNDELGNQFFQMPDGSKAAIHETPSNHQPANIIGLRILKKLELFLSESGFKFNKCPEYL